MFNFSDLLQQYPTRETVRRIMPDRLRRQGRTQDDYLCPFHRDRHASFTVDDRYMRCETHGCLINGGSFGGLLDFIKEYYNLRTMKEVVAQLTGQFPEPPKREVPLSKPEVVRTLSWNDVTRGEAQRAYAIPYFTQRGMKESSVTAHHLGRYTSWPKTVFIGGQKHVFRASRYTLPDIAYGKVRNIELRLDEAEALRTFRAIPHDLIETLAQEIEEQTHEVPSEMDLVYECFGARYLRVPGGIRRNLISNVERVIQRIEHNGIAGWFSPDMPYVLLHEGALKAWVVEDSCDEDFYYPSISAKGAAGLASIPGVQEIIVVQDNDRDTIRPDGTKHNPGRAYAAHAVELSGRRLGSGIRIITPPAGLKAADDVVLAGGIHEWLGSLGIEPVRRLA